LTGISQGSASQPQQPAEKTISQQSRIGRSMDIVRGKSMDVPRSQASGPSPHRQSQDTPQPLLNAPQPQLNTPQPHLNTPQPPMSNQAATHGQVSAPVPIPE